MIYPTARRARGFTLIELLTVIAIIGVLAAILIPTVGKVRSNARETQKASNYRQIWIANTLYANDNKGRSCPSQDANQADWRRNLAPYLQMTGAQGIDYRRIPLFIDPLYKEYDETVNSGTRTGIGMNDQLGLPVSGMFNNDLQAQNHAFKLVSVTYPEPKNGDSRSDRRCDSGGNGGRQAGVVH
jgi:prepilin-type N-terminal cleavage/methylation domain-containing protein